MLYQLTKIQHQIFFTSQNTEPFVFFNSCVDTHDEVINFKFFLQPVSLIDSALIEKEKREKDESINI